MYTDTNDETHYTNLSENHPHMNAILMSWGDNDIDQPGETVNNRITYDIVRSLITLSLFFLQYHIAVFILPPLPRTTPSLTTHQLYTTAAINITHSLFRHISDLRIPYTPMISLPSLSLAEDGVHFTTHSYHILRTTNYKCAQYL